MVGWFHEGGEPPLSGAETHTQPRDMELPLEFGQVDTRAEPVDADGSGSLRRSVVSGVSGVSGSLDGSGTAGLSSGSDAAGSAAGLTGVTDSAGSVGSAGLSDVTGYDADSIETLEGLEAVRKRPAMYVGGNGSEGLMHLVWEIIDNAVDEAASGCASRVDVTLHRNGSVEVSDNGRGIPVDIHSARDVSALEVVFTELHAGGKFGEGAYKASGGLHGVGAAVVNALSTRLDVQVLRDGVLHELSFRNQKPGHFDRRRFVESHELQTTRKRSKATGTRVRFWPDTDLFHSEARIDADEVRGRLRQTCFLVPGLRMTLEDHRPDVSGEQFDFVSRGGLVDLVRSRSDVDAVTGVITLGGIEMFTERVPVEGRVTEVQRECRVDIALRWIAGYDSDVVSFVNTIPTSAGGTHLAGFDKALTRAVNNILLKDNRKLARLARRDKINRTNAAKDDVQEGLVAAVKVTFSEPQFRGQTKQELGTPAVEGIVARIAYEQLREWFDPGGGPRTQVKAVADKIATAVVNRVASKQMLDTRRKAASFNSTSLPHKLADCRTHGPTAELVLVEGDSAAGPAKRGRDAEFMAILPLRGKIVNAAKARPKQVMDNAEAQAVFAAMGAGIGQDFEVDSARYGRIVILCDADVDGSHIRCLLLTLIHRYMRPMLEQGKVYAAQPPLYTTRVGDKTHRAYSEAERDRITNELCRGNRSPDSIKWQRFKGLGEMNTDELRYCALDPVTRTLRRLTMADAQAAEQAARTFDVLMGDDVAVRRDYLVEHSSLVDEAMLDV